MLHVVDEKPGAALVTRGVLPSIDADHAVRVLDKDRESFGSRVRGEALAVELQTPARKRSQ